MTAKILVVEDDVIIRKSICEILQKDGHEAVEAGDGEQALEVFSQRHFDLVISDFVMPQLHGLKLVELIHFRSPKTPVIFLTGYLSSRSAKALLPKTVEFAEKPVALDVLLSMVRRLLRSSFASAATVYRRKRAGQSWHFCTNCSNWPTTDYEEEVTAPGIGELCNECKTKREQQNCH